MRNFLEVSRPCRHSEQSWPANRRGLTVTCCMFIPAFQKGQGGAERKKRERRRRRKKSGVGGTNTAPPKSRSQHVTCNVSQRHVVHGAPSRRTHPTPVFSPPPPPLPPPQRAETCLPRGGARSLCPTPLPPRKDSPHAALLVLLFRFPFFPHRHSSSLPTSTRARFLPLAASPSEQ